MGDTILMENQKENEMTFLEYIPKAMETAKFRDVDVQITCSLFGLQGETVELRQKIDSLKEVSNKEIKKEFGDVYWYMASLFTSLNIDAEYWLSLTDGSESELCLDDMDLGFFGGIFELAKKAYRKASYSEMEVMYNDYIAACLVDLYYVLQSTLDNMGFKQEEILQMNIDKLKDRMERDVLHSSGDNR